MASEPLNTSTLTGNDRRVTLIAGIAIATLIKLLFAWFTVGTNDVVTWRAFATNANLCGACAYTMAGPYGDPFIHPPFILHFLRALPITEMFPFWLRLPSIVADIGTVVLVSRLLPTLSMWALLLLALNPILILISGFHGNTDPVMVFFIVVAVYGVKKQRWWLAGCAFGMALNIKVVPLLLLPCFLVYVRNRIAFCTGLLITVIGLSLPYVLHDPATIARSILGYQGLFINSGPAHYADLAGYSSDFLTKLMRYLMIAMGVALPFYLRHIGASLYAACAAILLGFYFLTPTLAVQYLAWGVPFVAVLSIRWMITYYSVGGALIALQYHRWSNGRWIFAGSHSVPPATPETEFLGLVLWICCGIMVYILYSELQRCRFPSNN